jgi:hypothetical protein
MSHQATVQGIYEAFGRGDVAAILDNVADDVVWDQDAPAYGIAIYEPGIGKRHVARFFTALQELDITRFQPLNILSGGNQVAVPIALEGSVKATGKPVKVLEIHLWSFGPDGKVIRFFHCVDRHAFVLASEAG